MIYNDSVIITNHKAMKKLTLKQVKTMFEDLEQKAIDCIYEGKFDQYQEIKKQVRKLDLEYDMNYSYYMNR